MATLDADDLDLIRGLLRDSGEGVRLADTVAHGGADATLLMKSAEITNPAGTALTLHSDTVEAVSIEAVAVNASALLLSSSGSGGRALAAVASGAGGVGAFLSGGVSAGIGLLITGPSLDVQLSGSGTIEGATAGASVAHTTLADGVEHGGTPYSSTATLAVASLVASNPAGDAVVAESYGGNGRGLYCTGNGTGSGLDIAGGGIGIKIRAGSGQSGINLLGGTDATALRVQAQGGGAAMDLLAGSTGGTGLNISSTQVGVHIEATSSHAVEIQADDTGDAVHVVAATGAGVSIASAGGVDVVLAGSGDIAPPAEAAGPPAGVLAAIMWLAARLGVRRVQKTASEVIVYLADGTTPATTQPYTSSDTSAEETGPAT